MKLLPAFLLPFFLLQNPEDALAQTRRGRGEIAVLSDDGERLGIEVNGRRYEQFSSRLLLGDIPPGKKAVIIYRLRPSNSNGIATAQTVYEGQMLVRENYRIVMHINPKSGEIRMDQQELGRPSASAPVSSTPVPDPANAPASTSPVAKPPATTPVPVSKPPTKPSGPPATSSGAPFPSASAPKGDWQKLVQSKNTDTERMRILKAHATSHSLTTGELIQMMNALSFEYSRLDLAKAALPNLTDRQNLKAVSAVLEDPASRKDLDAAARESAR